MCGCGTYLSCLIYVDIQLPPNQGGVGILTFSIQPPSIACYRKELEKSTFITGPFFGVF